MLNGNYYKELISKHSISQDCNKLAHITAAVILTYYKGGNVYFNFPKSYNLQEITNLLYEDLSRQIFIYHADIADYSVGDRLKRKGEKGKNIYVITAIESQNYILEKENEPSTTTYSTFDRLTRNYTPVKQSTRNSTLSKFNDFFKEINTYGFLPTHFSKKLVLIAGQTTWSNLKNKNCIPSTYLPNTRDGEQTTRHSIEALEDCIAYVTPKYEVCYDEILKKGINVDTIIVCNTDLNSSSQIISDQAKYKFKLIILSNESEVQKPNNTTLWNWKKEEIEYLEQKNSNKIEVDSILDEELDAHIQHFEECVKYVSEFGIPIKLKSYGYYLRSALNYFQVKQFKDLIEIVKRNKELERNNDGDYEISDDKNPKEALKNLISYLKENNPKLKKLNETISNTTRKTFFVIDRENIDSFKTNKSRNCQFITQAELKKIMKDSEKDKKTIVFNSFNGLKDFDFIYNLPNDVRLVLHKQEKDLYFKQLQNHTKQLEEELISADRFSICGIKYEPIVEEEVKISPTLEDIIKKIDEYKPKDYDNYKDDTDSLLDNDEIEKTTYQITFYDNSEIEIESNETVFDSKGNLIKSLRLNIGDKIRIYPKENLAENLYQTAVEENPELYGKIEAHSKQWQSTLKDLDRKYTNRDELYKELKNNKLRVLSATVDSYFRGNRKFPMFNSDLKAILILGEKENLFSEIIKSKRQYNSTMITLGRGIKQELKMFLQTKKIGDILSKKNFTSETLQKFIETDMPLLTVTKIEEINDEQ